MVTVVDVVRASEAEVEGFENAKTAVIETIVDELRRARPTSKKVADAAKKLLKRVEWLKETSGLASKEGRR